MTVTQTTTEDRLRGLRAWQREAFEEYFRREPRDFLAFCLEVERRLKRERRERWGPRLIDIDVLMFGDRQIDEPGLEVPHPRMSERAFVLVPLAEIAPDIDIAGMPILRRLEAVDRSGIVQESGGRDWWRTAAD